MSTLTRTQRKWAKLVDGMEGTAAHFVLLHYALREPMFDAVMIARGCQDEPLSEADALYVMEHWNDPEVSP